MNRESRVRRLVAVLASAGALALVSCGGDQPASEEDPGPRIPDVLAQQLAQESEAVARSLDAGDSCAALAQARRMEQAVATAIDRGRVPAELEAELRAGVAALVGGIECVPKDEKVEEEVVTEDEDDDQEGERGENAGKGDRQDGKGKGKDGHGKEDDD